MRRATFLSGFVSGYVLGARAGRQRYEQIVRAARSFASNPKVQGTADTLQHQAGDLLSKGKGKISEVKENRRQGQDFDAKYEVVEIPATRTPATGPNGGQSGL
jgi:hypothetical protein